MPLRQYALMPFCPFTLMPLHPYALMPLCPYALMPLRPYALMPLRPYAAMPNSILLIVVRLRGNIWQFLEHCAGPFPGRSLTGNDGKGNV